MPDSRHSWHSTAWRIGLLAVLVAASSAGCKSAGRVDAGMILPPPAERLEVKRNEVFIMATQIERVLPVYPELPKGMRPKLVEVCAEFVIREDGAVDSIRQIQPGPDCEPLGSATGEQFYPAVERALQQWTFFSAGLCTYAMDASECDSNDAAITPLPVRLAYRFRFEFIKGRGSVRQYELERAGNG